VRCGAGCRGTQQPSELMKAGGAALRGIEFETDLQVAAIHIELGDTMLLEELDQLSQIFNILLFHSFLGFPQLPTPARGPRGSKFDEGLWRRREHFATVACDCHHIFNANSKFIGQVNPRLDSDDHTGFEPRFLT
jgi:hypothetical protein